MNKKPIATAVTYGDKTTHARTMYDDGTVALGKATTIGGDKYVPVIGAVIAMCKSLGAGVKDTCADVVKAVEKKHVKKNVKVKMEYVRRADGRPVGNIKTGKVMLALDGPLAKLAPDVRNMGKVGDWTKFYDKDGQALWVGDLVIVDRLEGTVREGRKWKAVPGLHFVVCEDSDDERSKGAYIMGMLDGCNPKTGKIDSRFRVKRAKTWKEVELGESHDGVKTVWVGDNNE